MTASPRPAEDVTLIRQLGLFDTSMVVVGIVIGSGIFLTTGLIARDIPSVPLILLAWLIGGLHALAGALTFAELGATMPEAGGQYVYLREAYGPFVGFLFGWVSFLVYLTGIIAALAVAFAEYFGYFFPGLSTARVLYETDIRLSGWSFHYAFSTGHLVALALILALSGVNYFGVALGKLIQNASSVIKIGALLALLVFGLGSNAAVPMDWTVNPAAVDIGTLITGFGIGLVSVIWTIAGWEEVSFIGGEIKAPERTLPRALMLGVGLVTLLYILVNYIYLSAMPVTEMVGVVRIGEAASNVLFGGMGAGLIAGAVVISVLGALNGTVMVGPRVYYAMARDGLFFAQAARVHPRYHTPGAAILMQAAWACVLTISGTYETLILFVIFVTLMLWIAAAAAVFTLRKKYPDLPRPYKTWGYPFVPMGFIIASLGIMVNMLWETPVESLAGLGLTALGIPVYFAWRGKGQPARR
jgi:APA family basic amino acid/polyamine antiporter